MYFTKKNKSSKECREQTNPIGKMKRPFSKKKIFPLTRRDHICHGLLVLLLRADVLEWNDILIPSLRSPVFSWKVSTVIC